MSLPGEAALISLKSSQAAFSNPVLVYQREIFTLVQCCYWTLERV